MAIPASEAGPAGDFGSLSAFLGVDRIDGATRSAAATAAQRVRLKAAIGTATGAPPGHGSLPGRPLKDSTLLNRKVAFKMLKQLGCEVQSMEASDDGEPEELFIEVGVIRQPVLFKMLVELGYLPQRSAEGEMMVRVVEKRARKPEEIAAALSAPRRPPRQPSRQQDDSEQSEGYPAIGRPKLRREDEQDLVNRLNRPRVLPRPGKPGSEQAEGAEVLASTKPRRTAAEQRAYLDRLLKPKAADDEVSAELAEAMAAAGSHAPGQVWPILPSARPRNAGTWPASSSSARSTSAPGATGKSRQPLPRSKTGNDDPPGQTRPLVRSSPRLVQAGLFAVQGGSGSGASSPDDLVPSLSVRSGSPFSEGSTRRPASTELVQCSAEPCQPEVTAASPQPTSMQNIGEETPVFVDNPQGPQRRREEEHVEQPSDNACVADDASFLSTGRRSDELLTSVRSSLRAAQQQAASEAENTGDWLERLLGPPSASKPADRRSRAEQRERLEQLAKPRQKKDQDPEPVDAPAPKARKASEQREACARLAVPRKPRSKADAATDDAIDEDECVLSDEDADWEPDDEQPVVKIIPSLLAQCPSRLERIDEDSPPQCNDSKDSNSQGQKKRPPVRARSQGPAPRDRAYRQAIAAYTAPVVPKDLLGAAPCKPNRPPCQGRGGRPQADRHYQQDEYESDDGSDDGEMSQDELARLAGLLSSSGNEDEAAQGEALLVNIDALYNQLLAKGKRSAETTGHSRDADAEEHEIMMARAEADSVAGAAHAPAPQGTSPKPGGDMPDDAGGEELLQSIDLLYNDMLQGNRTSPAEVRSSEEEAATQMADSGAPPAEVAPAEKEQEEMAAEAELPALLEEVLWSALLMARGSAGTKRSAAAGTNKAQARLLELLPPGQLTEACRRCPNGVPPSLLQRLAAEMPQVHAATLAVSSTGIKAARKQSTAALTQCVREARDSILASAVSPRPPLPEGDGETSRPSSAGGRSIKSSSTAAAPKGKSKPRRSSLSYWTDDALDALEAPMRKPTGR
eukprot:TRINITY_DN87681_c0_g1_i1.p1 TRINITY_DN87681_c0_g1~~TRINITY_DN87681_c0_g1_i1.p1  ORF type:complete len:1026 (-),score=245.35 TRINITY_DN87681_c0_g1_i1:241-3318(-)